MRACAFVFGDIDMFSTGNGTVNMVSVLYGNMVPPGPGTYSVGLAQFAGQHIEILPYALRKLPNTSDLAIPAKPRH